MAARSRLSGHVKIVRTVMPAYSASTCARVLRVQMIKSYNTVEVVNLMLSTRRGKAVKLCTYRPPFNPVQTICTCAGREISALTPGMLRQPSELLVRSSLTSMQHRIDTNQRVGLALFPARIHHKHPDHRADLRPCKAPAGRGIHRLQHIRGQCFDLWGDRLNGAQVSVSRGSGHCRTWQHTHPRASSRLNLTILRVIIWRLSGLR